MWWAALNLAIGFNFSLVVTGSYFTNYHECVGCFTAIAYLTNFSLVSTGPQSPRALVRDEVFIGFKQLFDKRCILADDNAGS